MIIIDFIIHISVGIGNVKAEMIGNIERGGSRWSPASSGVRS